MKIIEHMGDEDDWPEWAIEARNEGRLFSECMNRIKRFQLAVDALAMSCSMSPTLNSDKTAEMFNKILNGEEI
jgi:hypothetical protein